MPSQVEGLIVRSERRKRVREWLLGLVESSAMFEEDRACAKEMLAAPTIDVQREIEKAGRAAACPWSRPTLRLDMPPNMKAEVVCTDDGGYQVLVIER